MSTAQLQFTETKKTVPAAALRFNVGTFEFAAAAAESKNVPVKLLGRSGKPIDHWYWGHVVHDMAGLKLHKASLPIDYCHYPDEVIGYLDKFDTTSGDLIATGMLVPFKEQDRAEEVIYKAQNKVPYEASINFADGVRLEEVKSGASATVNGQLVNGPALIIREWSLRGIAICPYGADKNTKTELSAGKPGTGDVDQQVEVTVFQLGDAMKTNETNVTQPATDLSNKPADKPTDKPAPAEPKPGQEFVDAFGDVGARWHFEGRDFKACAAEFIKSKDARIAELEAQVKTLNEQIKAMPRGNEAATFQAEKRDENPRATQFKQKLGNNIGRFAAGIKLPTSKADNK